MPMQVAGVVTPATVNLPDGAAPYMAMGRQGEQLVSESHGRYYTQTYRGNCYYGSLAAPGVAFTLVTTAAVVGLLLWNPSGSGKNVSLIRCSVGLASTAASGAAGFCYGYQNNMGNGLGTGAPFSIFTQVTLTRGSCICGPAGQGSSVVLVGSGATLTTAFSLWRGAAFGTSTGIVGTQMGVTLSEDFDGNFIIPPGSAIGLTCLTAISGITGNASFVWEEIAI